jgi:hypothetical protein
MSGTAFRQSGEASPRFSWSFTLAGQDDGKGGCRGRLVLAYRARPRLYLFS